MSDYEDGDSSRDSSDENYDPRQDPDYDWSDPEVTEDKLRALAMERDVMDIDHIQQTMRLLKEAAPGAAVSIIALSRNAANENTRLNAAKFLVEKVLDPEGESGGLLEDLVGDLVKNAEKLANGHAV